MTKRKLKKKINIELNEITEDEEELGENEFIFL